MEEAAKRLHPEDRITVDKYMERLMSGEDVEELMEYRWRIKNGEYHCFSDVRSVIRDEQGRSVALVGNSRDITKRKQIEDELQRAHDELELRVQERTAELRKRADQLARLSSELTMAEQCERQRMAQVLHDHLQQLLAGAKLQLETLVMGIADHQKEDACKIVNLLAESLKAPRSLTMELAPPALKNKGIAAAMIRLTDWMKNTHGLTVELKIEPDLEIDREEIRILVFQSIRELLFNAAKHSGTNTATLELKLQENDCLQVLV